MADNLIKIITNRTNTFFTDNSIIAGNGIPTEGNYTKGDVIINNTDNSNGDVMWICIESGTPGQWKPIAGNQKIGHKVSNYTSNVIVDTSVTEVSLSSLETTVREYDKLLVHFNSTYLVEGVDYDIIENGTKIVKKDTTEPWNESNEPGSMFALELIRIEVSFNSDLLMKKVNVIVDEPINEISLEGLGVPVDLTDKLLVHFNSTHLLEGVDYEIVDGNKIVKLTEGMWNKSSKQGCLFSLELFKNVAMDPNTGEIVKGNKMVSITNTVNVPQNASNINIGIETFDANEDTLLVFKNSVFLTRDVDYTVIDQSIQSINGNWNINGDEDYSITFVVLKNTTELINPEAPISNGQIKNKSITLNKLSDDVRERIITLENTDEMINRLNQLENNDVEINTKLNQLENNTISDVIDRLAQLETDTSGINDMIDRIAQLETNHTNVANRVTQLETKNNNFNITMDGKVYSKSGDSITLPRYFPMYYTSGSIDNSTSWHRLFTIDFDANSNAVGGSGCSFILQVGRTWSYTNNEQYMFTVIGAHNNWRIRQIDSAVNAHFLKKIRVVVKNNYLCVDAYIESASFNGWFASLTSLLNGGFVQGVAEDQFVAVAADDYTNMLKELTTIANGWS